MTATANPPGRHRPLVIAHRGASGIYPEHTAAAYLKAITDGADGLECDVRLTADGVIVCMHDRRIDRTSDRTGVLSAKTYSQLAQGDYASWKRAEAGGGSCDSARAAASAADSARAAAADAADERALASPAGLLRLDQLIDIAFEAGRELSLSIETKHPVRFAGLIEDRVIALLRRRGLLAADSSVQPTMMSFSETALRRVRELEPGLPTVLLMERIPVRCRSGWLPGGARIAGLDIAILRNDPESVARFRSAGSAVYAWVVDSRADVELCLELGVEAIITNRPDAVRSMIEASEGSMSEAAPGNKKVRTLPTGDAAASEHP